MDYRPFLNTDPPALVEIWRGADPRSLAQQMNVSLLEGLVLSKPYFDRQGLIVACEGDTPVGFGHAGFGPTDDRRGLSHELGVIGMVVVRPSHRRQGVGRELVARLERYLVDRGASRIYAGGVWPFDPFYGGLYGGNLTAGVLESDEAAGKMFQSLGYRLADHIQRMRCDLSRFRPPVDRRQLLARRTMTALAHFDPPPGNWWEACTLGDFHRVRFDLVPKDGAAAQATAVLWSLDPIAWRPGERVVGLSHVQVIDARRRQGFATFLLAEAFRELKDRGFSHVETQILEHDQPSAEFLKRLGFAPIDRGNVYRKDLPAAEKK
jgi:GNAT superfamily N-acetyltransferase